MTQQERTTRLQIRCLVSNIYDLQKLRIAIGNRLVQSFYIQMGIEPSHTLDEADDDCKNLLNSLIGEYKLISDLMAQNKYSIKKQIAMIPKSQPLQYIHNELDYKLIDEYMAMRKNEENTIKVLSKYVHQHPMWDAFFRDIPGCGELMAANCIAYLDIEAARHVSSFWKYCGLDTVIEKDENGNTLYTTPDDTSIRLRQKFVYTDNAGVPYTGKVTASGQFDANGNAIFYGEKKETLTEMAVTRIVDGEEVPVYEDVKTGTEYCGNVIEARHGRRMGDTEMREYTAKDGTTQMKKSLTYNPELKAKLVGVLAGCFIKAGQRFGYNKYEECYRDYKSRLDNNSKFNEASAQHKHNMAVRYMIKQFLRDLWVTWRSYEGYQISEPYEVAYLGNKPHKYNEAHHAAAQ